MTAPRQTVALEEFLAGLPAGAAAGARAAAARIDELERGVRPPNRIERNLAPLAIAALILFVLGVAAFAGLATGLRGVIGFGGVVLLIAAFPALVFAYSWSVRWRTAADRAKMALNAEHFLPHGGLYFGAPQGDGRVVRVEVDPEGPDLRQQTEALYRQSTARRWWW